MMTESLRERVGEQINERDKTLIVNSLLRAPNCTLLKHVFLFLQLNNSVLKNVTD